VNIALLRTLQSCPDAFFWPESLARSLEISPARLLRDMRELESFGFEFEWEPHRGWRFALAAPRLCVDQIEWELGTTTIGRRILVWQRVSSTNDIAARAAASRSNNGLVVLAEEQTAGRGRRSRRWFAPAGSSILMSVLLFVQDSLRSTPLLTSLAAVAVAEVISENLGLPARIKWPNDVRLEGKKFCGILVEDLAQRRRRKRASSAPNHGEPETGGSKDSRASGHSSRATVIGIGINANLDSRAFPQEIRSTATSLSEQSGGPVDRSELARRLIIKLDQYYNLTLRGKLATLWERWQSVADLVGGQVQLHRPKDRLIGKLLYLRPDCAVLLEDPLGTVHQIPLHEVLSLKEFP
jgi:BirA family biotin operon repressor/biotin-[acetyl-CoA-carboxylase] ligase